MIKQTTVLICDRCGKHQDFDKDVSLNWKWSTVINQDHYDLCYECKKELSIFLGREGKDNNNENKN